MSDERHRATIHIPRLGWFILGLVALLPWVIVVALVWRKVTPETAAPATAPRPPPVAAIQTAPDIRVRPSGPWGELQSSRIFIEPPEEFIPSRFTTPNPPRWVFPPDGEERIQALWDRAGLGIEQKRALNDPARRQADANALIILPDPELVLGLAPAARATIYTALAAFPANVVQSDPFRFPAGAFDQWLGDAGLPEPILALTKKLLYRRGGNDCFSDHEIVLRQLPPERRGHYVKALSRKSSLIVQLRVPHDADADALARYWGTGRRSKDLEPILQSLAMRPNGGVLDIVHLLPPFARRLLYTFPIPTDDQNALNRDCHWTSFNFYQDPPDDRLTDLGFVQRVLGSDYFPVNGQPTFGDVLMFVRAGNQVVHSCVYLADNIVFTKNGAVFSIPWQLAELDQVRAFYSLEDAPLEVRCYRRRNQ